MRCLLAMGVLPFIRRLDVLTFNQKIKTELARTAVLALASKPRNRVAVIVIIPSTTPTGSSLTQRRVARVHQTNSLTIHRCHLSRQQFFKRNRAIACPRRRIPSRTRGEVQPFSNCPHPPFLVRGPRRNYPRGTNQRYFPSMNSKRSRGRAPSWWTYMPWRARAKKNLLLGLGRVEDKAKQIKMRENGGNSLGVCCTARMPHR